jgi:hypothetical protein
VVFVLGGKIFGYAAARRKAVFSYWIILFHTTDCWYTFIYTHRLLFLYTYKSACSAVEQSGVGLENCFRAEKKAEKGIRREREVGKKSGS